MVGEIEGRNDNRTLVIQGFRQDILVAAKPDPTDANNEIIWKIVNDEDEEIDIANMVKDSNGDWRVHPNRVGNGWLVAHPKFVKGTEKDKRIRLSIVTPLDSLQIQVEDANNGAYRRVINEEQNNRRILILKYDASAEEKQIHQVIYKM